MIPRPLLSDLRVLKDEEYLSGKISITAPQKLIVKKQNPFVVFSGKILTLGTLLGRKKIKINNV